MILENNRKFPYGSPSQVMNEQFIEFYDLELQIVISELKNTLEPSLISSEACQIVLQLMMQNAEYTKKNGKSEKGTTNAKQLIRLFELVSKFNTMAGDMNTFQLQNNAFYAKLITERKKNQDLQKIIDNIKNAEEWE